MSHSLPESDFRAFRVKLDPDDFALSYGPDPPPSDLIPEDVWHSIQDLPSDVSIRTSDHHGTKLKGIHELLGFWISEVIEAGNLLDDVFLDANEEFQAVREERLSKKLQGVLKSKSIMPCRHLLYKSLSGDI